MSRKKDQCRKSWAYVVVLLTRQRTEFAGSIIGSLVVIFWHDSENVLLSIRCICVTSRNILTFDFERHFGSAAKPRGHDLVSAGMPKFDSKESYQRLFGTNFWYPLVQTDLRQTRASKLELPFLSAVSVSMVFMTTRGGDLRFHLKSPVLFSNAKH